MRSQLQAFDASLADLQSSAPTESGKQAVSDIRGVAAALDAALASDVRLRIGPPAPTVEQLDTSNAVIAERVRELDAALDRLEQTAQPVPAA